MNNRGSIYMGLIVFYLLFFIFLMFFAIVVFQIITMGELHNIKNDMFLINRNALFALQRDIMGEDVNAFHNEKVKKLLEEEIKRQWNIDVSSDSDRGFIKRVDIKKAQIINLSDKMYIESELDIELRPLILKDMLNRKLSFKATESVKVEKLKGWRDDY